MSRTTNRLALAVALALIAGSATAQQPFIPIPYKPTIVPLDVATVTTGTPATVLSANHRTAGGFLITSNAAGMCVSENGTAGTTTGYVGSVATVCVVANQPYTLQPSTNAVSVTSPGTGVAISGYGLQ